MTIICSMIDPKEGRDARPLKLETMMSDPKLPIPPLPDALAGINTQVPNDIPGIQPHALADVAAQSAHQTAIEAASFTMQPSIAVSFRTMGIETTYFTPDAEGHVRVEVNALGGPATPAATPSPNPKTPKEPKR